MVQERPRPDREALREAIRARLARRSEPVGPTVPTEPVEPVKSPPSESPQGLGFRPVEMLQNAPGSFVRNAKAALWDLPKAAGESLLHYAMNPKEYLEDIGAQKVKRFLPEIVGIVKDDYRDFYDPDNFGAKVTEDPFRVVSDVAAVASLGGGAAATTGKVAAGALKGVSRGAARAALTAGKIGRGIAKVERIDPSSAVLLGAGALKRGITDAIGVGKYSKAFKTLDATLGGEADVEAYAAAERMYGGRLKPEDHELLIRSFARGHKDELAAMQAQRPDLWQVRENMKAWLKEDEKYYTEVDKLVSEQSALDSKMKALVRYNRSRGIKSVGPDGMPKEFDMDDAIRGIKSGEYDPVYFKIFREHDKSLFDAFSEPLYRGGSLSRAERRALDGEIPSDIYQILSHQLRTTIGTKKNIKLARAAQELLAKNGDLRYVTNKTTADEIKALKKAGFAPLQSQFFEKYHESMGKATTMIAEAAKKPGNVMRNVLDAAEQAKDVIMRAEEAVATPPVQLWAPAHAVQWLNLRLSPGDRLLGKAIMWGLTLGGTLPYYKAIATVMNPRYWAANAVGDAVLSFLYGVHPQALRFANKLRDLVPDEIKNIGINKLYQSDYNLFQRTANRLQNYAQNIDNYFKRAVYINEMVKEGVKAKLLTVGRDFFVAEDQLIPFITAMSQRPNQWVDNLAEITRMKERIAATAIGRVESDQQRATLGKRYARSASKEGPKGKVAPDEVYGPEYKPEEIYHSAKPSRPPAKIEETGYDPIYSTGRPESAVSEAGETLLEKQARLRTDLKRAMAFAASQDDAVIATAIDNIVKELADVGRQLKGVASKADVPKGVVPDVAELGIGPPSVPSKVASQYDVGLESVPELTAGQKRIQAISKLLDENQAAREQKFADLVWSINEMNKLESLSPALARESAMVDRAIDVTAQFFGSYNRLSPWEKKVVRQFIPFYTFTKAMTQLAFRIPFMMPKRQFIYLNLWRAWTDLMDNDGPNNSFYKSVIPVMALDNGDVLAIKVSSLNPFGSIRTSGIGGAEIPTAYDIFGNHPVLRLAMGTRGQITPKPLQPGTTGTRLDNGEVWRYDGDGKFKRVLLQPSFAKTLWSLFPQTQLIDSLLLSGAQASEGFALNPKTIMGPDGKPLFPIGWPERIITAIVPATRINPAEMMQRDMAKLQQIRRSFMKELRYATPAKRQAILAIMREMSGDIRRHYLDF